MNLHLGADVRQRGGDKFGELQGIVYDPQSHHVMALVVQQSGLAGEDTLVTARAISGTDMDGEEVYLNLTPDQFANMKPLYERSDNIAPPPDAANVVSNTVREPFDIPDVPPLGAAVGVESIAFTPLIQEITNLRQQDVLVGRSTLVRAMDGDVGQVVRVFVDDDSGSMTGLVAERGLVFTHDVFVPMHTVASLNQDEIELNVDKGVLQEYKRG
ncbi:MAG: PRC-barrel domain-containing protein [Chloroflexota bacterium]|nr:MAG: hypothetical protein DLM70_16165 [Chloroflexota bacterium]